MPIEQEIVEFPGPSGEKLVGILHEPPLGIGRRNVLFILSHGGLMHKTGAYRVHTHLARFFASRGCSVFRFDPPGIGDSDGTVAEQVNLDLYGRIQTGILARSYGGAFDYLKGRYPNHKWILSGVCGGAISSLLAGVDSPYPIAGYALFSCPVVLDGSQFDYSRSEPAPIAAKVIRVYVSKLLSPQAVWRFVTLQSDYRQMGTSVRTLLVRGKDVIAKRFRLIGIAARTKATAKDRGTPCVGLNPGFPKVVKRAMKRSELLFIYGNNDGSLWSFNDLFAAVYLSNVQRTEVLRIVDRANHLFTWPEWQDEAFELIDNWLKTAVLS